MCSEGRASPEPLGVHTEELCDGRRVGRGRHCHHPQVGPRGGGGGSETEGDVAVCAAFVNLVDEHDRDTCERRVVLQAAEEDTVCDIEEARGGAGASGVAGGAPNEPTDWSGGAADLNGDAGSKGFGGDAAGYADDDGGAGGAGLDVGLIGPIDRQSPSRGLAPHRIGECEGDARQLGRFAAPRRTGNNHTLVFSQGRRKIGGGGDRGQGRDGAKELGMRGCDRSWKCRRDTTDGHPRERREVT